MAAARWSFISRAMATPSAPGTRSGPGPLFESTCTVMPASSIDLQALLADLGQKFERVGPPGVFLGRKPRRLIAPGSPARGILRRVADRARVPQRRFPPPWSVEETNACFIVRDGNGQAPAYVYFKGGKPGRRATAWSACSCQFTGRSL